MIASDLCRNGSYELRLAWRQVCSPHTSQRLCRKVVDHATHLALWRAHEWANSKTRASVVALVRRDWLILQIAKMGLTRIETIRALQRMT